MLLLCWIYQTLTISGSKRFVDSSPALISGGRLREWEHETGALGRDTSYCRWISSALRGQRFGGEAGAAGGRRTSLVVEDYAYPRVDQILAEHGLKVFKGDGHILFVTSRTFEEGQCPTGQIQVEKSLDEEPYGVNYCFETRGTKGYLSLEVPATFGVRGGDKPIVATAQLPDRKEDFPVPANEHVAIDPGQGTELPKAILVELRF